MLLGKEGITTKIVHLLLLASFSINIIAQIHSFDATYRLVGQMPLSLLVLIAFVVVDALEYDPDEEDKEEEEEEYQYYVG